MRDVAAGRPITTVASSVALEPSLDHLVYAVPDLDVAVAAFLALSGLSPVDGGRHLGLGSRNVLVGLGPTSYLEIVGPDRNHPPTAEARPPFGLAELIAPRLVTWAIRPIDIRSAAAASAAAGADLGVPQSMSRRTSTGVVLEWELATAHPAPFGGVTPFVIDWGRTTHPTAAGLPPARLRSLAATHPEPTAVQQVLRALGVLLPVSSGPAGLVAVIETPAGLIELR